MPSRLFSSNNLLTPEDPAPFKLINGDSTTPILLLCDHASRVIPFSLGKLGLGNKDFNRHIAYDIGAEKIAIRLSAHLNATLITAGFSRLVIDLNRPIDHPDSVIEEIDDTLVPANKNLTNIARRMRIEEIFRPYHRNINTELKRKRESGTSPLIFSIHSFSPNFGDAPRPWDIGILWNRDPRIAIPLIKMLKALNFKVGDNEPYSGKKLAYTIDTHGGSSGLANCVIEINQKHISNAAGIQRWADILTECLHHIMKMPQVYRPEWF